jgi:putative membrane protein
MNADTPRRPGFADDPDAAPTTRAAEVLRTPALLEEEGSKGAVAVPWAPADLSVPRGGLGTLGLAASGIAVLLATWAAFGLAGVVADQFATSPLLGWLSLAAAGTGAALLGAAVLRELRGLASLGTVDGLAALLADPAAPVEEVRSRALAWVRGLARRVPETTRVVPAITAAGSVAEIAAHLRAGVAAPLAAEAARIGRRAAVQGGAIVALSPSPGLDGVIALWRGLRVVREVATLHGLRPGLFGTARLMRRTISIAATTAGADLIAQTAAEGFVGATPVVRDLAAAVPGAGIAAFRLYRLAVATAAACLPLPPRA